MEPQELTQEDEEMLQAFLEDPAPFVQILEQLEDTIRRDAVNKTMESILVLMQQQEFKTAFRSGKALFVAAA